MITIWVPGHARTKGSLDRRMQDSPVSKRWRALIASEARQHAGLFPAGVPVWVRIVSHLPAVGWSGLTATGSGDTDKLARNVLDALTDAGVYHDDAQVVACLSIKMMAGRSPIGQLIAVGPGYLPEADGGIDILVTHH